MERTPEELKKEYDNYYLKNPHKWGGNSGDIRDRLAAEAILRFIDTPTEILDIGCGNGHTLAYLEKRFKDSPLYGLDLSGEALKLAGQRVPKANLTEATLLDYKPKKKFQVIVSLGVLEHFENIHENLEKIKSLMKKESLFYVELPNNLVYSKGDHSYRRLETGSKQVEWHLDRKEWEKHFKEAEFEVMKFIGNPQPQWGMSWVLV